MVLVAADRASSTGAGEVVDGGGDPGPHSFGHIDEIPGRTEGGARLVFQLFGDQDDLMEIA